MSNLLHKSSLSSPDVVGSNLIREDTSSTAVQQELVPFYRTELIGHNGLDVKDNGADWKRQISPTAIWERDLDRSKAPAVLILSPSFSHSQEKL